MVLSHRNHGNFSKKIDTFSFPNHLWCANCYNVTIKKEKCRSQGVNKSLAMSENVIYYE